MDRVSDCIEWDGPLNNNGYGSRSYQGRVRGVHVIAFFEANGFWPNVCRHACDNRRCMNPEHLLDGTQADNMRDCIERGRFNPGAGERHASARLNVEAVKAIRWMVAHGYGQRRIARAYRVDPSTVSRLANRTGRKVNWKEVPDAA